MTDQITDTGQPEMHFATSGGREAHVGLLLRYWETMRKNGDVPRRSDIDPRGIEPLLENALIAEKVAPGLARLRIAGSHLTELMGMEVRGMPLSAFVEPSDRPLLADALTELFERPAQIDLTLTSKGGAGKAMLTGRLILLPLRSDLGDISRALGVLISSGQIGVAPRRFAVDQKRITPVTVLSETRKAAGFAEPAAPYTPPAPAHPPAHPSERPYLRLVK